MKRRTHYCGTSDEWIDCDGEEREIRIHYEGYYDPGSYDYPPEGDFYYTSVLWIDTDEDCSQTIIELTDAECAEYEDQIQKALDSIEPEATEPPEDY